MEDNCKEKLTQGHFKSKQSKRISMLSSPKVTFPNKCSPLHAEKKITNLLILMDVKPNPQNENIPRHGRYTIARRHFYHFADSPQKANKR